MGNTPAGVRFPGGSRKDQPRRRNRVHWMYTNSVYLFKTLILLPMAPHPCPALAIFLLP